MTVYVIAQVTFTEEALYRRYQERFGSVFAASGGRVLAADESPTVLEGAWRGDKVVLMSFPSAQAADSFLRSPAYQEISKDRMAGAQTIGLMVKGLPA